MSHKGVNECRYAMSSAGCQPDDKSSTGWKHYTRGWKDAFNVRWHARETRSDFPPPTVLSYATEEETLSLHYGCDGQLTVAGETISTGTSLHDGDWHHVAMTWDSLTGRVNAYDNGNIRLLGNVT